MTLNALRRSLVGLAAVAVTAIAGVQPAIASQGPVGSGSFQFLSAGTIISSRMVGPDLVIDITTPAVIGGTLAGNLVFVETDVIHPDHSFDFSGTMTCQCTVDGRSGTLVIKARGATAADGSTTGKFKILEGTGGLAGLEGRGTLSQTPAQAARGAGDYLVTRLDSQD